jgi:hypothetical protein
MEKTLTQGCSLKTKKFNSQELFSIFMKIELKKITVSELSKGYQDNAEAGVVGYDGKLDTRRGCLQAFGLRHLIGKVFGGTRTSSRWTPRPPPPSFFPLENRPPGKSVARFRETQGVFREKLNTRTLGPETPGKMASFTPEGHPRRSFRLTNPRDELPPSSTPARKATRKISRGSGR